MVQVARSSSPVRARPNKPAARPRPAPALAVVPLPPVAAAPRDYRREDLVRIAEVGFHYTLSGGLELSRALFEGLTAVAPDEPLFAIGLGLTLWKCGELEAARVAYARAASLDPDAPLPDLSQAELLLEGGHNQEARRFLSSAFQKAERAGEAALAKKAKAMFSLISTGARS